MKVAAIDIGTNSVRFMVLEQTPKGQINVVAHGGKITRLGEGAHLSGKLKKEPQQRTLKEIQNQLRQIQRHHVDLVELFATSAMREAQNGKAFAQKIKQATARPVTILSGQTEAERAYFGITSALPQIKAPITLDIGGGSTEIVFQNKNRQLQKISLKLGAVRLKEAVAQDWKKAVTECEKKFKKKIPFQKIKQHHWIGAGGTLTTLAAIDQKLKNYSHEKIHGYPLKTDHIEKMFHTLKNLSPNQLKKVPGLSPKRADIIVAGTAIVLSLLQLARTPEITVSDRGILYGSCLKLNLNY
jgi:exopolyphosphatase/guanosine-5'-triphosphate,3'-diphosphate pyrophosphatase